MLIDRKSKVFYAMIINVELVAPKVYLKREADGQWVNIPIPDVVSDGVTKKARCAY
jgi:hypothetical protein